MQAAGLESPSIPHFFSRDLHEISPALNEDLLDLYGRSEQVLANRFAFLNHTEALDAGFNWELHESPGSPALAGWRRELHAFDYAFDLALTYRISRESRYAVHLRYLIAHWIAENPPGLTTGWELRPLARRVRNWILSADLARDEWEHDSAFLSVFQSSLALQCAFLERHAASARSLEAALDCARALHLAAKFFNGPRAEELRAKGRAIIQEAAGMDSREDGPSGLSPVAALREAEALIEILVFHSPGEGQASASLAQAALRILVALEGVLLPDGTLPLFGSSASSAAGPLTDLFALGAVLLDEAAWKKLAGGFGIVPYMLLGEEGKAHFERLGPQTREPESRAVAELGLYRLSGAADSAMIINCVRSLLPGAHEDYASYELGLNGHRVVVDSGAYSPDGESWDKYFQTARAHNVLLVNGCLPQPGIDHFPSLMPEDLKSEEGQRGLRLPVASCDRTRVKSQRVFFCLEGRAWVVLDLVWGEGRPRLQNLLHFYPPFEAEAREDCAVLRSRSQNVTVIPLGPSRVRIQSARGVHSEIPGFYAPDFGVKFAAATLSLEILDSPLPWLGGYLIVPGATPDFQPGEVNPATGTVSFELSERKYFLRVR